MNNNGTRIVALRIQVDKNGDCTDYESCPLFIEIDCPFHGYRDACLAAEFKVDEEAEKRAQVTVTNMCPSNGKPCETRNCKNCEGYSARAYLALTAKLKGNI